VILESEVKVILENEVNVILEIFIYTLNL